MSGRTLQPGDAGYRAPDENFASSQPIDELINKGYSLSDEQYEKLTPEQRALYGHAYTDILQRERDASDSIYAGVPVNPYGRDVVQGMNLQRYDPRFPGQNIKQGVDPNFIDEMQPWEKIALGAMLAGGGAGLAGLLGPGTMAGTVGAGFGSGAASAGLGAGSAGVAAGSAGAGGSSIPGLSGLSNVGTAAGSFPLTTAGASGLEAGLFPLTTAGAGGGAGGLGALGAGASMGDLSNIATQGSTRSDILGQIRNAYKQGSNINDVVKQLNPQQPGQQATGEQTAAQIPYDSNTPLYLDDYGLDLNEDSGLRLAGGGFIGGGITDLYTSPDSYAKGGYLDGPGDGMSDSIPATINGTQPAALADGEWVAAADLVSHIGNGSSKAGAKKLDEMAARIRAARTGNPKQGKQINPDEFLPA